MNIYTVDHKSEELKTELAQIEIAGILYFIGKYTPRFKNEFTYTSSGDYAALFFPNVTPLLKTSDGAKIQVECISVNVNGIMTIVDKDGKQYIPVGYWYGQETSWND